MLAHWIVPHFSKSSNGNNELVITGKHTVSHPSENFWFSAIATESIPATVDGEYIFVVRMDSIQNAWFMIGVTPMETFDSSAGSHPGSNGMTGCALYLSGGTYYPDGKTSLVDPKITTQAEEVIVVVTIAKNGAQKLIRWIVDGTSTENHDCTADCNGEKLFPVVSAFEQHQQATTIPLDHVTIRNHEIHKLFEKISKQTSSFSHQSQATFANINNQRPSFSSATALLQQELDQAKQRENALEAQVRQQAQQLRQEIQLNEEQSSEIAQLKQQLFALQAQFKNSNSLVPSPFVKDKMYQIGFSVNGITPPADPNAFGTLLKLPSQNNSVLFQHVKNELWKKLGTFLPSQKPVTDFTLELIEVIYSDVAMLEGSMHHLQQLQPQNGNFFNPPTGAFTAEQLQTLIALRDQFLPRSSNADPKSPNLINVFHGTKVDRLQSVVNGLVAVRSTDAGYFGSGVYTTTSIEYAAKYAKGDFDFKNGPYPPRASDDCIPVVWCVAAVGVCYPLTREVDYSKKRVHGGMEVSDFFGMPLTKGYDCHCVAVNESVGFQAVPRDKMQYMEIVFDQEVQVLPIAVLWVKEV